MSISDAGPQLLAALAGLLHDIGKFWQRSSSEKIHPDYRHFNKNDYGANGAHATFSAAFIQQFVPEPWRASISASVLYHHMPQDASARLIALADRLSAGVDRERSEELRNPMQMLSVFSRLNGATAEAWSPLSRLALNEASLMPSTKALDDSLAKQRYANLWPGFTSDAHQLARRALLDAYLEGMLSLMQQHTWAIPSAYYGSEPDISLYDHSRTTAALAACLTTLDDSTITALLNNKESDQPIVTFVEGDLSGVQRFLYTVPARGATKQLRARSVYLQILTEATARWILRRAGMPAVNIIYSGGGRFFALIPSLQETDDLLDGLRCELDQLLLRHHDGDLAMALGWTHLSAGDFNPDRFPKKWREVTANTAEAKRARYADFSPEDMLSWIFDPRMHDESDELWLRRTDRDDTTANEQDAEQSQSALAASFVEFSTHLAKADYLIQSVIEPTPGEPGGFQAALAELGVAVAPARRANLLDESSVAPPSGTTYALIHGLREPPAADEVQRATLHWACPVVGTLRYLVNETAMLDDGRQRATFDQMQQAAGAAGGLMRLGVLRMDVDDLGNLFANGFRDSKGGSSRASLSRVASLSFALSLFFEGWVGELCARINLAHRTTVRDEQKRIRQSEAVYAVYSGGDDLFIVGRWDVLPGLAEEIQRDLRRYTSDRLHLSGGLTLHGGKYPLYQAADEAKEALEVAKELDGKNAMCFLGEPLKWTDWPRLTANRDTLYDLIKNKGVPRALLQSLIQLHQDYTEAVRQSGVTKDGQPQVVWGPWLWRSAYQFARLAERTQSNERDIRSLYAQLKSSNFQEIVTMGLAARWVEALTRQGGAINE